MKKISSESIRARERHSFRPSPAVVPSGLNTRRPRARLPGETAGIQTRAERITIMKMADTIRPATHTHPTPGLEPGRR